MRKSLVFAVVTIIMIIGAKAYSETGFTAYRGVDGQMSAQSRANLATMIDLAKQHGSVRVWVGFDLPFQATPELRTPEVVAAEARAKQAAIEKIIAPLILQGKATQIAVDETAGAPGCMLTVNRIALRKLAKDEGVRYIGYLPDSE